METAQKQPDIRVELKVPHLLGCQQVFSSPQTPYQRIYQAQKAAGWSQIFQLARFPALCDVHPSRAVNQVRVARLDRNHFELCMGSLKDMLKASREVPPSPLPLSKLSAMFANFNE